MAERSEEKRTVHQLSTIEEFRECQKIQRAAWGIKEEGYIVPVATLAAVNKYGGLVLGARINQILTGFSFAFLGRLEGQLILYSQLTAVLPALQGTGTGLALKQGQREWAAGQGLSTIAWAFDPLQAGNANFNLHLLGARCRLYEPDMYGERQDALNRGLAYTDRLIAEWAVSREGVQPETSLEDCQKIFISRAGRNNLAKEPGKVGLPDRKIGPISLELPLNLKQVLQHSPEEAQAWQLTLREAFQHLFKLGYTAVDFLRPAQNDPPRGWYIFI